MIGNFNIKKLWLEAIIAIYLVSALIYLNHEKSSIVCSTIDVVVADETDHYFVEEYDVLTLINKGNRRVIGASQNNLNILELERNVSGHPSIRNAEVFRTVNGNLKVNVWQRNPIVRILNYNNESYYIDEDGAMMPLSKKYTARTLVVNGSVNVPYELNYTRNVLEAAASDELKRITVLKDIFLMSKYIHEDKLLSALIEQVYVENDKDYRLVPKIGPNEIEFGSVDNYETKFRKLKILYLKGLPQKGWDRYKKVNLKFKNQVVCTKI